MSYRNEPLISAKSAREALGSFLVTTQSFPTVSSAWINLGGANRAIFYPIRIDVPGVITKLWWRNGAAVSGNVDIAIYSEGSDKLPATRLASAGSTAQSGTNVIQAVDITDVAINYPQRIFCALVLDNNTGAIFCGFSGSPMISRAAGYVGQASAFPLPATAGATAAAVSGSSVAVDFGISFRALVA